MGTDKKRKVDLLLVIQDASSRVQYRNMIEDMELNVHVCMADCGSTAIEKIAENDFGCLVLDSILPDMPAKNILAAAREDSKSIIPSVVFTTEPNETDRLKLLEAGVSDFISKDECTPELLRISILYALIRNEYSKSQQNYEQALVLLKHKSVIELAICKEKQELKEANSKLHFMAMHDALTSLPNRLMLLEHLDHSLQYAKRNRTKLAVLYIDLDRFKLVNDSLGHDIGDQVLLSVVHRIKGQVRRSDILARVGGDEFVLLIDKVKGNKEIEIITQKINRALAKPIVLDDEAIYMSASIGVDILEKNHQSAEMLIKRAAKAMYQAKTNGRNDYVIYSEDLITSTVSELSLNQKLHNALKNNELELYYQPKVNSVTFEVEGAEALLRWINPSHGESPSVFIPIAEESNLILDIGQLVMEQACEQLARWKHTIFQDLTLSVNVSSRQFIRKKVIDVCQNCISQSDIDPRLLELEVTERVVFESVNANRSDFSKLKDIGLSISIDDFGTGFSSLSYLKNFPFDVIKIDGSFIRDLPSDRYSKAIISSILHMTEGLGLKAIAECVENKSQFEHLRDAGCNSIQGFYFSKPLPVSEFELWVQKHQQLVDYKRKVLPNNMLQPATQSLRFQ